MYLQPDPDLAWFPTHVQITVLQAQGLRAKGKHGTSDAYTLIQMGREKYSTSVVEKSPGSPEWKEECSFELAPGALERGESCDLQLIVMHRALIGMDQFLGQVSVPLHQVYREGRSQRNQWYKLHSKSGKKEKERGEIQISIQFTRNNLTASMFDLSIKDKPKTPFGKLKDKMKIKKRYDMESSSAIIPSSVGRLDSDDETKPKSKAALFFKGHLRKNSLTKSNTSLGSDSTISSASGVVTSTSGISIVLPDVEKKPAARNSSLSTEPSVKDEEASPRMTHKRAFSDEVSKLKMFPEPKFVQNLNPKSSPISKSSVCINGSHVYAEVPMPKPTASSLEKSSLASRSFQNIAKKTEEAPPTEGAGGQLHDKPEKKQEWKPSVPSTPPHEETRISARISAQKPKIEEISQEGKPVQITTPLVFIEDVSKDGRQDSSGKEGKKPKVKTSPVEPTNVTAHIPASAEEKGKTDSWFSSKNTKESSQKPSFPSGSIDASEAAEWGSSLVEEHSPLAFSPPAKNQVESPYQLGHAAQNMYAENHKSQFAAISSPPASQITSELELQFDEFASSRLQSSPSAQRPSETEDQSFVFATENFLYEQSIQVQGSKNSIEHELQTSDLSLPDTNNTEINRKYIIPVSPDQCSLSYYASHSPTGESARIKTLAKDSPGQKDLDRDTLEEQIAGFKGEVLWHTDEHFTAKERGIHTTVSSIPDQNTFEQMPQNVYTSIEIQSKGSESNDKVLSHINGAAILSENRIAAVSPLIVKGIYDVPNGLILSQNDPDQSRESKNTFHIDKTAENSCVHFVEDSQSSMNSEKDECMEDMSKKLFCSEVAAVSLSQTLDTDSVKQPDGSLQIASEYLMVPPKPPRLMLSSTFDEKAVDDNYKQTSNQDHRISRVSLESPEDKVYAQNTEVDKQTFSPVTCCPVIEGSSISVDTQSTTEDLFTNLREENNDLTKLGTANREHLFSANETTMAEQFLTCPSKVSLDALDLSSVVENSNKLDVFKHGPQFELMNDAQSKPLSFPCFKQEINDHNILKNKCEKENENETQNSNSSKQVDCSNIPFWSALEEHMSYHPKGKSEFSIEQLEIIQPESKAVLKPIINEECRIELKPGKILDVKANVIEYGETPQNKLVENNKSALTLNIFRDDSRSGQSMSQQSSWSADIVMDFKNEDFWKSESDLLNLSDTKTVPSPGNPFTPPEKSPFHSHKNPFVKDSNGSLKSVSFKDVQAQAVPTDPTSIPPPAIMKSPFLHGSQPLAVSTPFLVAAPNPNLSNMPSPVMSSTTSEVTTTTNAYTAALSCYHSPTTSGMKDSTLPVLPQETQPAENPFMPLKTSPHPVKPITTIHADAGAEKKQHKPALSTALTSGLEMLKSVTGGQLSTPKKHEQDRVKDVSVTDVAAKYYHLTHDELIQMLLQREAELDTKSEHVRELEDYIDQLLVRIIDQAPTLLQVPIETKKGKN
ncbi:rab11 family-interacting protein 5 [Bombina bombina]|uniref:rab11 family-interacting protein 5 n=1 Tax=Bombina bombina TaxID=8345 RepID=UPI00235AD81E|nr:rab11 family-interacting protein 5 [Bombina bombina]